VLVGLPNLVVYFAAMPACCTWILPSALSCNSGRFDTLTGTTTCPITTAHPLEVSCGALMTSIDSSACLVQFKPHHLLQQVL